MEKSKTRKDYIEEFKTYLIEKFDYIELSQEEEKIAKKERPSCIELELKKNNEKDHYFFAIMAISKNKSAQYYDYMSLPEWVFAIRYPEHFKFVIIRTDAKPDEQKYYQISPSCMISHAGTPPFKTYFSLTIDQLKAIEKKKEDLEVLRNIKSHQSKVNNISNNKGKRTQMSPEKITQLIELCYYRGNN